MKIRNALILAAGKGTRMGDWGKSIPKPLWKIFDKTLIEHQIQYISHFFSGNLFINGHHEISKIKSYTEKFPLKLIEESELLGVGGAVSNCAKFIENEDWLLLVNSDQFLVFDFDCVKNLSLDRSTQAYCTLIEVSKELGYSCVQMDESGYLKKIIPTTSPEYKNLPEKFFTYSGLSVVNLGMISKETKPAKLFGQTLSLEKCRGILIKEYEYFDLGTLEKYKQIISELKNCDQRVENLKKVLKISDRQLEKDFKIGPSTGAPYFSNL